MKNRIFESGIIEASAQDLSLTSAHLTTTTDYDYTSSESHETEENKNQKEFVMKSLSPDLSV
jgi:hypothetical protein